MSDKIIHLLAKLVTFAIILIGGNGQQQKAIYGYAEVDLTYMSSDFPGKLNKLFIEKGQQVKKGQKLYLLEQEPQQSIINETTAALQEAEETIRLNKIQVEHEKLLYKRRQELFETKYLDMESVDIAYNRYQRAIKTLNASQNNFKQLKAKLTKAKWEKSKKIAFAPLSGLIFDTYYKEHEFVPAATPVLSIFRKDDIEIIFFVSGKKLPKIKLGQTIAVMPRDYPQTVKAKITYISPHVEFTPPMLFTSEATTKFLYRIEAKATADNKVMLYPGQPVKVYLNKMEAHNGAR